MAKMFYTAEEAADRLGQTADQLKDLVREGRLREFRDAGTVNYKIQDVDAISPELNPADDNGSVAGASSSGAIVLEPVEDSSIELAPSSGDVIGLEEAESAGSMTGTATGSTAAEKAKEDTVVPSVGVNVFDDDDLDEHVDPLAQTAITDVAGLGVDAAGSGSGILNLTRESDDTSLGKELLDEIYTGEGEGEQGEGVEMGDATRAGLEEVVPEADAEEGEQADAVAEPVAEGAAARTVVRQVVEYGPDAVSTSLTALMVVAVAVMGFAGLAAAGLVRGVMPALVEAVYTRLWMFAVGAVVIAAAAAAVAYLLAKRSG